MPQKQVNPNSNISRETSGEKIESLGKRVAKEIKRAWNKYSRDYNIDRISLVGYSMGGLIFRAALPDLNKISEYLSCFVTLATPHLGYLTTNSKLLTAGMWVVGAWKNNSSIKVITLTDKSKLED